MDGKIRVVIDHPIHMLECKTQNKSIKINLVFNQIMYDLFLFYGHNRSTSPAPCSAYSAFDIQRV